MWKLLVSLFFKILIMFFKKPVKQEEPVMLDKKNLELELKNTQDELLRLKNEKLNEENKREAEKRAAELEVEGTEWLKTQPKFKIEVVTISGTIVSKTFEAKACTSIWNNSYHSSLYNDRYSYLGEPPQPIRYEANLVKTEAKTLAQQFIEEAKMSGMATINNFSIPFHAIERFEISEVKGKK